MTLLYWPYDEIDLQMGEKELEIIVDTPWLKTTLSIQRDQIHRARSLVQKFQRMECNGNDLAEVNWFFGPLASYPLCYILPRAQNGHEQSKHSLKDDSFIGLSPAKLLAESIQDPHHASDVISVSKSALFKDDWKWDGEGAIKFSTVSEGVDPMALFSVARRYHLLGTIENDVTNALYDLVESFKSDQERSLRASALMVRQNHYVTERCYSSLAPALANCKGAKKDVEHFIKEEKGHDRILFTALKSMVNDPLSVPVLSESKILMDLLRFSAERNFLAFAIVVDAFERSSYQDSDPLAKVLKRGGFIKAAAQIDRHKNINDSGEHENLALSFIKTISSVESDYALEALRIAEMASNVMNLVSSGVKSYIEQH